MKFISFAAPLVLLLDIGALAHLQQEATSLTSLRASPGEVTEQPEGLPVASKVKTSRGGHEIVPALHQEYQKAGHGATVGEVKEHPQHEEAEHGAHGAHAEHGEETTHGHHGKDSHTEKAEHGGHAKEGHHSEEVEHLLEEAKEEGREAESFSLAALLMGSVASLMFVFYLVNSTRPGIKEATWRVLNMTVAIFVAVLVYGTLKMLIIKALNPGVAVSISLLCFFVFLFISTHFILFKLKDNPDKTLLAAASTVSGHMSGFAAMYGFADSGEVPWIEELGLVGTLLLIVLAGCTIAIMTWLADKVVAKVAVVGDGTVDEEEQEWIDTCDETDDDVFCLAISFLCVLFFRHAVTGRNLPYEPGKVSHGDVSQSETNSLLILAFLFLGFVAVGAVFVIRYHSTLFHHHFAKRTIVNVQHANSMVAAWLLLFWSEWQLYVLGWDSTVIGGCLVNAIALSFAGFSCVFIINRMEEHCDSPMAKRALGSLELALGVLIGFSWERAFDVGLEEIELKFEHWAHTRKEGAPTHYHVALLSLILVAIVAPAWRLYILPKALASMQKEAAEEKLEDELQDRLEALERVETKQSK